MKCSSHWLERVPEGESLDILRDLAWSHACEAGPYEKVLKDLIHKGRFRELCELEIDYSLEGLTVDAVRHTRQALAFFQKLKHLDVGVDRERKGLEKFLEAEALCAETNKRLQMRRAGTLGFPARVDEAFRIAQRKIRMVLNTDPPSLEEVTLRLGPGSTRKTRKAEASVRAKMSEGVSCSEELFPLVKAMLRELPHLSSANAGLSWVDEEGDEWDLVDVEILTARLEFVSKNALSLRSMVVQPLLNLMYQLGYGAKIAQRLAAFGVDIRRQEPNKLAAKEGSFTGALATLDLSSASDTISREIVYELLPLEWAHVLSRGRTTRVELPDGSHVVEEKFSSMGNGFTFPLETLIFWGLAAACCGDRAGEICVYGDDIIVPSEYFDLTTEVLRYAGFNLNLKKSFAKGPFRESCGADWFRGSDVRPFYQKEWISGQSLFVLHNWYVRHGDTARAEMVRNRFIHPALHVFGPQGFGDGHLIGEHVRRRSLPQEERGFSGYFFESFTTKSRREVRKELKCERGDFPAALYTIYVRGLPSPGLPKKDDQDEGKWWDAVSNLLRHHLDDQLVTPGTPVADDDSEMNLKAWSLPGYDGYKKIRIYTLGA